MNTILDPNTAALVPPPASDVVPPQQDPAPLSFLPSVLTVVDLETLEIPKRECLVGSWWREGASGFIYAPRGLGKTWFGLNVAVCLAEGRDCGPWKITKRRRVLYVDGEMPLDGLRDRYRGLRQVADAPLLLLSHEQHFRKTGAGLNLADPLAQAALLTACLEHHTEVLFLDNLSCLFLGVRENDADDWESVQPWLLTLRRLGIAVCIIHHSGRNSGHMRGTTKREDSCSWVIGLTEPGAADDHPGACFVSRFTKNREGEESDAGSWQWAFHTTEGRTNITFDRMEHLDVFVQHVLDGLSACKDIADEMGVTKGAVSKWAKRAAEKGLIRIDKKLGYLPRNS